MPTVQNIFVFLNPHPWYRNLHHTSQHILSQACRPVPNCGGKGERAPTRCRDRTHGPPPAQNSDRWDQKKNIGAYKKKWVTLESHGAEPQMKYPLLNEP